MLRIAVSIAALSATSSAQPGGNVIEFEMEGPGDMDGPPPELLKMMGFDVGPPSSPSDRVVSKPVASTGKSGHSSSSSSDGRSRSSDPREEDLDRALRGMLGDVEAGGPQGTMVLEGPDGELVVEGPPPQMSPRSRMPVEAFHGLFPGPLAIGSPSDMDAADVVGFGGPDPMVMDMLQDLSQAFQEQMLPAIHAATGRIAPQACAPDLKKHCGTARSQLHCLGQHSDEISSSCKVDVGKSVPFLCSAAIDHFCDILQTGILSCLEAHMDHIDGACKDSVLATRHVIKTASTQKATLVQHAAPATKAAVASPSVGLRSTATLASTLQPSALAHPAMVHPKHTLEWAYESMGVRIIILTFLVGSFAYATQSFFEAAAGSYPKGTKTWLRAEEGLLRGTVELPKSGETTS